MAVKRLRSKNNRPVVLFDMDDVITDCLGGVIERWNALKGTSFERNDVTNWNIDSCLGKGAHQVFFEQGFFLGLKEKNNSIRVIRELIKSAKYDIYIVTACQSAQEIQEKMMWLERHIPEFNLKRFIACKEKHMLRSDIIFDDRPENLDACQKHMDCVLYDMPHNVKTKKYERIFDFQQVPEILEKRFYS